MPGPEDTWQSYGYGWANASNTPFRMFKQYDHKGGMRVPLIVQWPAVIAKGGQITRQIAHVIDLLPTALDAAGVPYPKTFSGRPIDPTGGKSMVPIFRGQEREPHAVLYWQFAHGAAIRKGNWKLVKMDKKPWELYDLEKDPVEINDKAKEHPEKVAELSALWAKWAGKKKSKK